jgi:hypothetical protein
VNPYVGDGVSALLTAVVIGLAIGLLAGGVRLLVVYVTGQGR